MSVIFALVLYSERSFTRISLCLLSLARHVHHVILGYNAYVIHLDIPNVYLQE